MFNLVVQNTKTVFLSISPQKIQGCWVYLCQVKNLWTLFTASDTMDSKKALSKHKDKALLLSSVCYADLHFCHRLLSHPET